MKIVIGADHGGFALKEDLKAIMLEQGIEVIDVGNNSYDAKDDYPDFASAVARKIAGGEGDKGIVICGSGIGACIAVNKFRGVRGCVCHDTYSARQGVEHDGMNVLCLGGRIIGIETAKELLKAYLGAQFSNEERHARRLRKVEEFEKAV
ncbi:MAG: ribose 5-phosphate isomerase B [Ignavibacteria bacterium]|nr:ribose 5-phosphate isomerase B [Ignavibacteria bacterium]